MNILKKLYHILIGRSLRAIFLYKISVFFYRIKLKPLSQIFWSVNVMLHSIEISPSAIIGKNFKLPHTVGTVIGGGVKIGDNVMVYQNVTLGQKGDYNYPVIEDNVIIYPGSIVLGNIKVGEGSIIGANSVVLKDVPSHATVVGSPAKVI